MLKEGNIGRNCQWIGKLSSRYVETVQLTSGRNRLRHLYKPNSCAGAKVCNSKIGDRDRNGRVDNEAKVVLKLDVLSIKATNLVNYQEENGS
jgi:hypothetical protein